MEYGYNIILYTGQFTKRICSPTIMFSFNNEFLEFLNFGIFI